MGISAKKRARICTRAVESAQLQAPTNSTSAQGERRRGNVLGDVVDHPLLLQQHHYLLVLFVFLFFAHATAVRQNWSDRAHTPTHQYTMTKSTSLKNGNGGKRASEAPSQKVVLKKAKAEVAATLRKSSHGSQRPLNFFSWLLKTSRVEFFRKYFEKKPLVASHGNCEYFARGLPGVVPPVDWSTKRMLEHIKMHPSRYGTDLNVVKFDSKLKKRVSYRTEGLVDAAELERCMKTGWSVRFLRPHEFLESNSAFIGCMEQEFNCYCGVNSYWTPANSQGFAPHYDDVDVFLLQLEGEKLWRLYDPPEEVDVLTRHSSEDYAPEQLPTPNHTITLKAGDVLYMPRGTVHQGKTNLKTHSLHITFSANQMNSWADFMIRSAQYTIETLAANKLEWRCALPRDVPQVMGAINHPVFRNTHGLAVLSENQQERRASLQKKLREMAAEVTLLLTDESNMDVCTDVYGKETIRKMQPPSMAYSGAASSSTGLDHASHVRLISRSCMQLLLNVPGEARVYHIGRNSAVCLAGELGELRFEAEFAPAIATLLSSYPKTMLVAALPFPGFDDPEDVAENQLLLVETLRDAGLLHVVSSANGNASS
ncbi:Cupin_superfamily_protein/Cupin-like_domain_containing_protein [Leishmania braziliensis MHOM/BR/75/M2904]|uniref:Bifunctional lysine-specific demethylase and histidyl-hydroxylase n=1 Tax=Leishmania braziliensis MHOM/BR/75/M2904 TaxID=420245 RepID=A0A3P3ZDC9_LEIBR|nr:Cupin_superfamily_protein/Cupin-like_domain_containing_protein [Leishmania braziliensis MHOM/BR/75/M2904]